MYYAIYFSPTYNTERVCKYFCDGEYNSIDLCKENASIELNSNDIAIIGVPSYSGRVPELALKRLASIKGNKTRCILISSYGNRASEDTLIELYDFVKKQGFVPIAGMELVGRHSIFKTVAKDRPDGLDFKDYAGFKIMLKEKLRANDLALTTIPGNRPYKEVKPSTLIPQTGDECVSCGDCYRACPAKAISKDNPRVVDASLCAHCMRCTIVCRFDQKFINPNIYSSMLERLEPKFEGRKPNNLYI